MSILNLFKKKTKPQDLSFNEFESWLNNALDRDISSDVVAFCFNLYDDSNYHWSIELIGANSFDDENSDWACDEVFTTRETPLRWCQQTEWPQILNMIQSLIKQYLEKGKYRQTLVGRKGLAVGFVEGDLVLL